MNYFELFPYVSLGWGILGFLVSFKSESSTTGQYNPTKQVMVSFGLGLLGGLCAII